MINLVKTMVAFKVMDEFAKVMEEIVWEFEKNCYFPDLDHCSECNYDKSCEFSENQPEETGEQGGSKDAKTK